jgi:hypothetical protein
LDIRTLVFAANLVALTMAAAFIVSGLIGWRESRALALWAGGFLAKALGQALIFARPVLPYFFSYAVANAIAVLGTALFWAGVLEYVHPRQDLRRTTSIVAAATGVTLVVWMTADYFISSAVLNGLVALFDAAAAWALLHERRPRMAGVHAFVVTVFAADSIGALLRVVSLAAGWAPTSLFEPSPFTVAYYAHVTSTRALLGIGLLTLLYRQSQEAERQKVADLEAALMRVRTLEGLLPICAWCKRIQGEDRRDWQPLEQYVGSRTNASFSHTICPQCAERFERGAPAGHAGGSL